MMTTDLQLFCLPGRLDRRTHIIPYTAKDYGNADSTKAYSCWASRTISALLPSRSPTTKLKPLTVGSIEMKDVVPSSFLREATALRHLPKSKIAAPSSMRTRNAPSAGE